MSQDGFVPGNRGGNRVPIVSCGGLGVEPVEAQVQVTDSFFASDHAVGAAPAVGVGVENNHCEVLDYLFNSR